jgi:hypothetical protein
MAGARTADFPAERSIIELIRFTMRQGYELQSRDWRFIDGIASATVERLRIVLNCFSRDIALGFDNYSLYIYIYVL